MAGATFLVVCLLGFTGLLGIPVSFITGTLSDIVCAQGRPDFLLDPSLPVPLWWHLVIALAIVLILTVLTAVVYLTYRAVRWGLHWWCKTYC
ncbi:hypothetical protein QJ043_07140 [Olsenella sp. YH-ols2217]|uniref:Uncharacterized protein n=1 Tax=Kribbibacterium absianum TaxID=3044210 RepID=A0ABT6ZM26_9ACTN|nr:hypothetical protein [Olsenella sp. YH-ols2217]MDJ1121841.1 hypothetical protein [Olsenella sp. YH-ols2216]MDJ1129849.1 hypothetical protein [Olsenella sp. YH-ols2217]